MSRLCLKEREGKRERLVEKHAPERRDAKRTVKKSKDPKKVAEAQAVLRKQPRNANPIRLRKPCLQCGRPRALIRKFGICRICLRNHFNVGDIPGAMKSSW